MVTDKNERQVKTGNGLLRFCMNVVGAALVCTGAGGMLLWLSLCMGWWLAGFIAYILWGFAALLVILLLCGIYVGLVNRNTLRRLSKDTQNQTYKSIVQPTKTKRNEKDNFTHPRHGGSVASGMQQGGSAFRRERRS